MADLWWENNSRVTTPDGHVGKLQVTRRERRLIAEGKQDTAWVLGTDGIQRPFPVNEIVDNPPEDPDI